MSAQRSGPVDGHDVIRLGNQEAVVVPIDEYRALRALRDRASAEEIEEAEMDAVVAQHKAWVADGRPFARGRDGRAARRPVTIGWTEAAVASAARYMRDRDGMRAIGEAIASLAADPLPPAPEGFRRGDYHRLRAGPTGSCTRSTST